MTKKKDNLYKFCIDQVYQIMIQNSKRLCTYYLRFYEIENVTKKKVKKTVSKMTILNHHSFINKTEYIIILDDSIWIFVD